MAQQSIKAKYDPDRAANGHFTKGNKVRVGVGTDHMKRYNQLRLMWFDSLVVEDMAEVKAALKDLAVNCKQPEVKFKAITYFLDRCLGRPTERVEMDVQSEKTLTLPDLSPEELKTFQKVLERLDSGVTDAEYKIVQDQSKPIETIEVPSSEESEHT